eukprot:m.78079 g.78079  ORF g.78079 m.78079 type:complete len:198 (-) comp14572_c0_seq2:422-1015(-)
MADFEEHEETADAEGAATATTEFGETGDLVFGEDPQVTLTNEGRTMTCRTSASSWLNTVITDGDHLFEFKVESFSHSTTGGKNLMVGVSPTESARAVYYDGWCYSCYSGNGFHNNSNKRVETSQTSTVGDVVGVWVKCNEDGRASVEFLKNGESLGTFYDELPLPLKVGASIDSKHSISFVNYEDGGLPAKSASKLE